MIPSPETNNTYDVSRIFQQRFEQGALELDCGIALRRLAGWFEDELDLLPRNGNASAQPGTRAEDSASNSPAAGSDVHTSREDARSYEFPTGETCCMVTLTPLENRSVGKVTLERTHLRVEGTKEAVDSFMRLFTLRFISAGG